MRNIFKKVAATAVVLAAFTTAAQAVPYVELRITDLAETAVGSGIYTVITASDFCSTFDAVSAAACSPRFGAVAAGDTVLSYSTGGGSIGTFRISGSTAEANLPGTPQEAFQNRSQTSALRLADAGNPLLGHRLVVDFIAYGFTDPDGKFKTLSGSAGMTANIGAFSATDVVTSFFSVDEANGLGSTQAINCTLNVTTSPLNESCGIAPVPWTDSAAPNSLFSMRSQQQFDIAIGSRINSTANASVRNVPEPMTTSLVAVALLGLGLASRRGAKKA